MGPAHDPMAVVDQHLKVRAVEGLRVADASVMPDVVRAIHAAGGQRAGDGGLLRERGGATDRLRE